MCANRVATKHCKAQAVEWALQLAITEKTEMSCKGLRITSFARRRGPGGTPALVVVLHALRSRDLKQAKSE